VDDRAPSLDVRRGLLKTMGYDVLTATTPESALAISDQVEIDLAVLDYNFPGHISGEELARELRARKPGMPLIMLSGYPELPASAGASVDVLLIKGAGRADDLLKAIASLLQLSESPAENCTVVKKTGS
jgi:CheY-like chemotaxis protein